MIRFKLWGVDFRLHVLAILAALLAYMLGLGENLPFVILSVAAHELAHIGAARLCGAEIEYIDIMCFGGAAKLKDIYSESRMKLALVALAGPLANLALALLAAAGAWWGYIGYYPASVITRLNLVLMIFNLMPALPLDGGRILYAISSRLIGRRMALCIGTALGIILALFMIFLALYGWYSSGAFNLTYLIMAVFITASALREHRNAVNADAASALEALCRSRPLTGIARVAVINADAPLAGATGYIDRRIPTLFAVTDNGKVSELITGEELARMIIASK